MRPRNLGDTGQIYVTLSVAREYAHYQELPWEKARRELTEKLLEARSGQIREDGLEEWRYRSRAENINIYARVKREGRLAVVVNVGLSREIRDE